MWEPFQNLFDKLTLVEARKERAIRQLLRPLPRCTMYVVIAGPEYGNTYYRCDVVLVADRLLTWLEGQDSESWRSSFHDSVARAALPEWLRTADLASPRPTLATQRFVQVLEDYIYYFMTNKIGCVYCHDCEKLYTNIGMTKLNKHEAGPYITWTDEWKCPRGHVLYHKDQEMHVLRDYGEDTINKHIESINVHVLDPRGNYDTVWRVGHDISQEVAEQARDPETGDLYALVTADNGKYSTHVLKKVLWLKAKEQFDSIEQEGAEAMARTRRDYPDLFGE